MRSYNVDQYSLQNIPVELLLSVTQKLANHLPAQPFPLEQEVSHADGGVGDEPPLRQVLNAFLWLPGRESHLELCCIHMTDNLLQLTIPHKHYSFLVFSG